MSYISLDRKELATITIWCLDNKETPLGIAYHASSQAIAAFRGYGVKEQLEDSYKEKKDCRLDTNKLIKNAFFYRDALGRIILDLIKRGEVESFGTV